MARRRGADTPNAFFTPRQVEIIRTRHASGEKPAELAREYECSYKTMWRLVNRATYTEGLPNACPKAQ